MLLLNHIVRPVNDVLAGLDERRKYDFFCFLFCRFPFHQLRYAEASLEVNRDSLQLKEGPGEDEYILLQGGGNRDFLSSEQVAIAGGVRYRQADVAVV